MWASVFHDVAEIGRVEQFLSGLLRNKARNKAQAFMAPNTSMTLNLLFHFDSTLFETTWEHLIQHHMNELYFNKLYSSIIHIFIVIAIMTIIIYDDYKILLIISWLLSLWLSLLSLLIIIDYLLSLLLNITLWLFNIAMENHHV